MAAGNTYVIEVSTDGGTTYNVLAGQLDGTMTLAGTPVDITNKASQGYIEYLPDFLAGKQVQFAGSFILTNEAAQNLIREAAASTGAQIDARVSTGVGGEAFEGKFAVLNRSDSAPLNDKVTMSVNLNSSGIYTYTAPTI